ncbi:MAG: hypothetical protein M0006_17600 [Magnetospirillum sp.]|nr:hypothetical protein [Magnetospirillum sp.]
MATSSTSTTVTTQAPLMYAPPTMNSPTIVDLAKTGGQTTWNFSSTQDVVFIDSAHTALNLPSIKIQGGHNIEVLGIDMKTAPGKTGALMFYGVTGTAYVDGVHIDNSKASGTDGIDIAGGAKTSLVIQNSSIENVNGAKTGGQAAGGNGHADALQTHGPVGGEINLYNVHMSTNYQGIFLAPQYGSTPGTNEPSALNLTNVDLHYTGPTDNNGNSHSYLLWTVDGPSENAYPVTFNNVYVAPRAGQDAGTLAVWPTTNAGQTNSKMAAHESGNSITWPGLPYTGSVTVGDHASFTDSSKIGTNFADTQAILDASTKGTPVATNGGASASSPATPPPSATSASAPATSTDTTHTGTSATDPAASTGSSSATHAPSPTAPSAPASTASADTTHTGTSATAPAAGTGSSSATHSAGATAPSTAASPASADTTHTGTAAATTSASHTAEMPLKWAPPTMNNPTIVDLAKTGSQTYWNFANNQDVIVIDSAHTTVNLPKIQFQGGHNIEVLGIDMQTAPGQTGAIQFDGITGTAFVDGVHIDNSKASGTDGIDIAGGNNGKGVSLIVQNTSIENVNGAYSGGQASNSNGHADGIQMQGPVGGALNLSNVHITTNYEGLFLAPQYSTAPSSATFSNVDLHYTSAAANDGSHTTYLLWTLDGGNEKPYPITFDNVYVQPRAGQQAIESAVWPKAEGGAVQNGDQISWPNLPYKGSVTVGDHASFADTSKIGVHFADTQAIIDASSSGTSVATSGGSSGPAGSASATTATDPGTTTGSAASTPATAAPTSPTPADSSSTSTAAPAAPATGTSASHTASADTAAPTVTGTPATSDHSGTVAPAAPATGTADGHTASAGTAAPTAAVTPTTADHSGTATPTAPAATDGSHTDASASPAPATAPAPSTASATVTPAPAGQGSSANPATPASTADATKAPAAGTDVPHLLAAIKADVVNLEKALGTQATHSGTIDLSNLLSQIKADVKAMGTHAASDMLHLANIDHIVAQMDAAIHPAAQQVAAAPAAAAAPAVDAHLVQQTHDHWH